MAAAGIGARLAGALGRRDEAPNVDLAREIAGSGDMDAVAGLIAILDGRDRAARGDAIKVLYEIGARDPELIAGHADAFLKHMRDRDNRIVWGALTALAEIARAAPDLVFPHLDDIVDAADAGSVIAKDQAVSILVALSADPARAGKTLPVLFARLASAAVNQLPMYAERSLPAVPDEMLPAFREVLEKRLGDPMTAAKKKRVETVLKRVTKKL